MTKAKQGDTVKVHVTGRLENGEVFDSTVKSEPLQFTIGDGNLISGFENAVVGMIPGEKKTAKVPPDQAFGPHQDGLVLKVDRKSIPPRIKPEVGMQLEMSRGDSEKIKVRITEVSESSVTVDANHPLAGKNLIFDLEFLDFVKK